MLSRYSLRQVHSVPTIASSVVKSRALRKSNLAPLSVTNFRKDYGFMSKRWSSVSSKRYVNDLIDMYSQPQMSMTHLMIGRHDQNKPALYYVADDITTTFAHADCERYSNEVAHLLKEKGVKKGDPVAVMLPKSPQLVFAALAIWRLGCVFVPLFAAFEQAAIKVRLDDSHAKVVITDVTNRKKFNFTGDDVTKITTIIDAKNDTEDGIISLISPSDTVYSLAKLQQTDKRSPTLPPALITPQDTICVLYTSGTTGLPKGVSIPSFSLASFHAYMEHGLGLKSPLLPSSQNSNSTVDVHPPQRYLSIADPAWAYGLYYNLIGPLLVGIPSTYLAGGFDPEKVLRTLADGKITHFAAAPSAYRALCAFDQTEDGSSVSARKDKEAIFNQIAQNLQCASSAGEPLNPEIIDWWRSKMNGRSIADHYGQSETGMTVNWHWNEGLKAPTEGEGEDRVTQEWTQKGSMGRGMPGFRMVCLAHEDGVVESEIMDEPGELAVDLTASPLMWFEGYLNNPQRTKEAISTCEKYYLTGDTVTHKKDNESDQVFWFSTRKDDVIKSSGYRIGPFDVENSIISDPRVAEVAVVGMPDKEGLRGEIVAAFVVLHPEHHSAEQQHGVIAKELQQLVRTSLSKHCYPRVVCFLNELPKTPSGKVQRFKLKQSIDQYTLHQ